MSNILSVNYDEAISFAKQFHDDGEDIVQLYSNTRQRVQTLHKEWVGEAADVFYDEMEAELLPALQRVSGALFLSNEVLIKVMKIIHEADEETAGFFKKDLDSDFGAGLFGLAGAGLGAAAGAVGGGDQSGQQGQLAPDAPIPEAPKAEQPQSTETPPAESAGATGGGGGGGGDSAASQGIQGDLKGIGTGVGGGLEGQSGAAGSSSPQNIPDHIFGSAGSAGNSPAVTPPPAGAAGAPQEQSSGGVGVAAGAAGVIGAAAAGAAKVFKEDQDQ